MDKVIKETTWLVISPSVYVDIINNKEILLYDTNTGKHLVSESVEFVRTIRDLYFAPNMGSLPLQQVTCVNNDNFKEALAKNMLLLKVTRGGEKPINLLPILNLQTDLDCNNEEKEKVLLTMGNKLRFLSGINVYLNDKKMDKLSPSTYHYRNRIHRQYSLPLYSSIEHKLSPIVLDNVLDQLKASSVSIVNIIYSPENLEQKYVNDIHYILGKYKYGYIFHCYYDDFSALCKGLANSSFRERCTVNLYIDKFSIHESFEEESLQLKKLGIKVLINLFVDGDNSNIDHVGISRILPVWIGDNSDWFNHNVMMTLQDIDTTKLSYDDLFRNEKLNSSCFGILEILSDGHIYALNAKKQLGTTSTYLSEIVEKELRENTSWRITRKVYDGCRNCRYRILCPPVSSYEMLYKTTPKCLIKK